MLIPLLALLNANHRAATDSVRYHVTSKTTTAVDMSSMGMANQTIVITVNGFITVVTSKTPAGMDSVHVTIDSSTFDGGDAAAYLPAEMTASPKGAVFDFLLANGKPVTRPSPLPQSMQALQFSGPVTLIVAPMHPGHPGDTWVDTVRADTTVASATAAGNTVMTWNVAAGDSGQQLYNASITGTVTSGTGAMAMNIQIKATSQVSGVPGSLASRSTSTGGGDANVSMAGQQVPLHINTESTVERIP